VRVYGIKNQERITRLELRIIPPIKFSYSKKARCYRIFDILIYYNLIKSN